MEYPEEDTLNIYTDGSSLPKPRRGGLGILFILIDEDGEEEEYAPVLPGYASASNNQMELQACVEAMKLATTQSPYFDRSRYRKILLRTDSTYVAGNYGTALRVWPQNGWLTKAGTPVDNAPEWKELVRLLKRSERQGKRVTIKWVRGKSSPRTKAVDKAAKKSAKASPERQLKPSEVRRKMTDFPLEIGSVGMEGQRMTILVFKTEFQALHRLVKVSYTVLSKASPFYKRASVAYAEPDLPLKRGHKFRVRMGADQANPTIAKVFGEVE